MERVFSGIQPSGDMHLGNALGAVQHWVTSQQTNESLFCVVDLHAMTLPYDHATLAKRAREQLMLLMAWGLDPNTSTMFIQSHVPEHTELAWILNCVATFGELGRMTQFKEKSEGRESVSVGLYTYPVLMAADILLYDSHRVPVGDDQRQHLELARDIAQRANHRFGDVFVVPKPAIPPVAARVMDLADPTSKMSKTSISPAGTIGVLDDPKSISKRIRSAVTDSLAQVQYDPEHQPGVSNLISILAACSGQTIPEVATAFAGSQYGPLKQATADAVVELLQPVQERYRALANDLGEVDRIIAKGATAARSIATPVIERVRKAVGLR